MKVGNQSDRSDRSRNRVGKGPSDNQIKISPSDDINHTVMSAYQSVPDLPMLLNNNDRNNPSRSKSPINDGGADEGYDLIDVDTINIANGGINH